MSDLRVRPLNLDFSEAAGFPAVNLVVDGAFVHDRKGGPREAQVKATGDLDSLWSLFEWLRCPIEVYEDLPDPSWWGYVHAVTVCTGGLRFVLSMENVYNKVAVAYSRTIPGTSTTERVTTDWASDLDSQARFGVKEMLLTRSDCSDTAAEALRDRWLEQHAWPQHELEQDAGGEVAAYLDCRGWYGTLSWRHFTKAAAGESYWPTELAVADKNRVGDAAANTKVAQSFTVSGDVFYAATIRLYLQKVLSPTDSLRVSLYQDAAGVPGAEIEHVEIAAADLTAQLVETEAALSESNQLSNGTTYWIVVERTGALDPANYYFVGTDEDLGYAGGSLLLWNGGAWVPRVPDADMAFTAGGVIRGTTQVATVVTDVGEFLAGTVLEDSTGVKAVTYRSGDDVALDVVEDLLGNGNDAGQQLQAVVNRQRYLVVSARPDFDPDSVPYFLSADGRLLNSRGQLVESNDAPVGQWCGFIGVPMALENSRLTRTGQHFIEEAQYEPARGWQISGSPLRAILEGDDGR